MNIQIWIRRSFLCLLALLSFASCLPVKTAVHRFVNTDLEDEDFVISQLYADESDAAAADYMPKSTAISKSATAFLANISPDAKMVLGPLYREGDDKDLYSAIAPWIGVPYKYGGTDEHGVDCSAFVGAVYKKAYKLRLARTAAEMLRDFEEVPVKQLAEGDLLFFTNSKGKVSHVAIYLKDGTFVHSSTSKGVSLAQLSDPYWSQRLSMAGRHRKL